LINQFLDKHPKPSQHHRIEFCDDGYSGTNFDRPAVTQLLDKARNLEINCIITKDFSRFGRSYIEVGSYLEQVFPFLGIRFISINDNYDSNTKEASDIDIALRSLIYDFYSKDISVKIRSGKLAKMKRGDYVNPYAPYGYVKSAENRNKLEVDPVVADVVRLIYELAVQGIGQSEIARTLNAKGYLSPSEYKTGENEGRDWLKKYDVSIIWSGAMVHRIIRDERYTGTMVAGRHERTIVGHPNKIRHIPKDEWIRVPNTHEAIVSKELFDKVQTFAKKGTPRQQSKKHLFTDIARCHHCKRPLNRYGWKGKNTKLFCSAPNQTISPNCFTGRILEKTVYDATLATIQAHVAMLVELQNEDNAVQSVQSQLSKTTEKLTQHKHKLDELRNQKKALYKTYNGNQMSKEDYISKRDLLDAEIAKGNTILDKLQSKVQEMEQSANFATADSPWSKAIGIKELNRQLVEELVESIIVYDIDRLEIRLNYKDGYVTQT